MKYIILSWFALFVFFNCEAQYDLSLYSKYNKALEKKKYKKAEKELIKISQMENDSFLLHVQKGHFYSTIGKLDSSAFYFSSAIEYAHYAPISFSSNKFKVQRDSLYRIAISDYDKIIEKFPSAVNYGDRGVYNLDIGLHREAIMDFRNSLSIDSTKFKTFYNLGIAYRRLELLDSALISYDHCIRLNDKYASAYANKGFVLIRLEEFEDALIEFSNALEIQTDVKGISYSLNNIGYCYFKLNLHEIAKNMVVESINVNPINSYAYRNLALIEIALNNKKYACEAIEKSIQYGFVNEYGDEILTLKKENCDD